MPHDGEHSRLSPAEIESFWSEQAALHGLDPASSWSDFRAIELEIETLARYVEPDTDVLDAGCGTGYSTVRLAATPGVRCLGIDYVPKMVELARERVAALDDDLRARVRFEVGDVRSLQGIDDASFDLVVCTRVLINLGDPETQALALGELGRVARPGGLILASEATSQGLARLNALRAEWGLEPIPQPGFNLYLDEDAVATQAGPELVLERVENFSSSYFVVTRVLKPLLAQALGAGPDAADPASEINRWASLLPAAGDYGTQKLFVLRKHG